MAFRHPSFYAYLRKKCRCELCAPWYAAYQLRRREERMRRTGEAFSGSQGGFVPGKPCACGCGLTLPRTSQNMYKRGHRPS